jgi:tetratricopeptide (TPR) repeat protein
VATSKNTQSVPQNVSSDLEIVKSEYKAGIAAFERGQYRESVQHLEKASALVPRASRLGGEVQIWLVTAYEAAGRISEAIALCEQLLRHPDSETSKQGRRLLYILKAPELKRPTEWLTQIPDLGTLPDNDTKTRLRSSPTTSNRLSQQRPQSEPVDLSQVNTRDNRFIWFVLIALCLTLGGFVWLNF